DRDSRSFTTSSSSSSSSEDVSKSVAEAENELSESSLVSDEDDEEWAMAGRRVLIDNFGISGSGLSSCGGCTSGACWTDSRPIDESNHSVWIIDSGVGRPLPWPANDWLCPAVYAAA